MLVALKIRRFSLVQSDVLSLSCMHSPLSALIVGGVL